MGRFSVGASVGDAFRLIRARPLAVFVWGLLMTAPGLGALTLMLPMLGDLFASMSTSGPEAGPHDTPFGDPAFAQMMQFQLASMLINVGQYLAMAVVYTGVFRAVLRPRETGFFSLRLGMDELRVAVVGLAIGIGFYLAMMIVMLLGFAVGLALWNSQSGVAALVVIALAIVAVVAFLWGLARVSLMAPASVLYRDFAFVQGWKLASGQGWPLVGLMVLIWLIIIAIEMALVVVGVILFFVFAGAAAPWGEMTDAANPFLGLNDWLSGNWYWVVIGGLAVSAIYGVILTLCVAPFASACRQLAGGDGSPAAEEAGSPAPAA